jgi:hypothetical protein
MTKPSPLPSLQTIAYVALGAVVISAAVLLAPIALLAYVVNVLR